MTEQLVENTRLTDTAVYVVNLDSGRVHRRFRIVGSDELADYPRCNLDQIKRRRDVDNREEVVQVLGRTRPKPCMRCFPGPTQEAIAADAEVPIDAGPVHVDPAAEVVSIEEMDHEDRP